MNMGSKSIDAKNARGLLFVNTENSSRTVKNVVDQPYVIPNGVKLQVIRNTEATAYSVL